MLNSSTLQQHVPTDVMMRLVILIHNNSAEVKQSIVTDISRRGIDYLFIISSLEYSW